MKLNTIKQQLENWEENEKKRTGGVGAGVGAVCPKPQPIGQYSGSGFVPRGKVVSGDILWKPIDKPAAMLLAKSSWIHQPPHTPNVPIETKQEAPIPRTERRKNMPLKQEKQNHPAAPDDQVVSRTKSEPEFNAEIASQFNKRTSDTLKREEELLNRAVDARAAMDVLCESYKASWIDFQDASNQRLQDVRMTRMAMDSEMRQLMASLREVRQFFLDKDHDVEVARLKEFVDLCERLQKLKQSGFLDTVADTLIRLS